MCFQTRRCAEVPKHKIAPVFSRLRLTESAESRTDAADSKAIGVFACLTVHMCVRPHVRMSRLRHGGAGDAHRQAHVRLLERRRVVGPVASHRHHLHNGRCLYCLTSGTSKSVTCAATIVFNVLQGAGKHMIARKWNVIH